MANKNNNTFSILDFDAIQLKIASPEVILSWSSGEVLRPETINYRTQKFEKDGLFCEKIFGPAKDWECSCGKYKKIKHKGIVCDKCGVEVTKSSVRRERMGHIALAVPVSHIWFLRGVPSRVGLVLNMSVQQLERVIYFASYIVTDIDKEARKEALNNLKNEEKTAVNGAKTASERSVFKKKYQELMADIKKLQKGQILSESEYYNLSRNCGQIFTAMIGAEAIYKMLSDVDLQKEVKNIKTAMAESKSIDKNRLSKRLRLLNGFLEAGIKPEWLMLTYIPVMPPDLRPMVQLNGGHFATSDLNDLYRRIINRNNRLKRLIDLNAPEVIQRNEKRMLQEAVDALIDNNSRKSQAQVTASTGQRRALKSLSDMLKGKQGRFRQNLLGKRVDYSGRSVIVVGPTLQLDQCGIPKKMALELFKPFVINKLIDNEYAHNIRTASRMIDGEQEEAYEMLDQIIDHHFVLLNRAPTLHRLSIQAFKPVLIEGNAIRLHPLVCPAFNADFDGDQMAVHVPLTIKAREESEKIMLSSENLLKPSSGDPITTPSQDIVLGIYHMTTINKDEKEHPKYFSGIDELVSSYQMGIVGLKERVLMKWKKEIIETSVGRALFNDIFPKEMQYVNKDITKVELKELIAEYLDNHTNKETAIFVDRLKNLGFEYVTKSGISLGVDDFQIPDTREKIFAEADEKVAEINNQYQQGLLTEEERKTKVVEVWNETKGKISEEVKTAMDPDGPVNAMVVSKARASHAVVVQMSGMKGLVAGPTGETIELPIKGSLKGGYNVLEYFISTHGARKGMADTALRTATAGYLTRRLVDVGQDIVVRERDCGDTEGSYIYREDSDEVGQSFSSRIEGRVAVEDIKSTKGGKTIVKKGEMISVQQSIAIEEDGMSKIKIRNLVSCLTSHGVCQKCYGKDLGRGDLVKLGQAVGIVAAQAIGEPGTQLTMRTFHIGGVAGADITQGLPRVDEIFEVRTPKTKAVIAEFDGVVHKIENNKKQKIIKVAKTDVGKGKKVRASDIKEYVIPSVMNAKVEEGDLVTTGQVLSEGHIDLKKLFKISGKDVIQRYITKEVQEIYQTQGEGINDKHIEIIVRQMISRVKISDSGDTTLLNGDVISYEAFMEANERAAKAGKKEAKGERMILGISKVALSTDSFLSAASFQETAKVLIDAATQGKVDKLTGLKENVIVGRLIPAGTGYDIDGKIEFGEGGDAESEDKSLKSKVTEEKVEEEK